LSFFSSLSIPSLSSPTASLDQTDTSDTPNDQQVNLTIASSPGTEQFVKDSLARGFPLIPFHYTSYDIVEKCRAQLRMKEMEEEEEHPSPARTKYRRLAAEYEEIRLEDELEEKSLQSVLNLAQQELELEAKTCMVLERRSESSPPDEEEMILSTVCRARRARTARQVAAAQSESART